jgi:enoyl-CoA hydratase/carnithine racemase
MSSAITAERVAIEVADHVATVTLTRPDKHNALDVAMFDAITAAAARVAAEPGVRAVVVHGEGPSFCSGLDVAGVMANQPESDALMDPLTDPYPTGSSAPRTDGSRCRSR